MQQRAEARPRYSVSLTEVAVAKVGSLLATEGASGLGIGLRVRVEPGGCSGLRYQLYFDGQYARVLTKDQAERVDEEFAEPDDEDTAVQRATMADAGESVVWFGEEHEVAVLIDKKSGPHVDGSVIDFTDTIEKQGFVITNPKGQGGCACGNSFH